MKTQTRISLFNFCGIVSLLLYFFYGDVSWLVWCLFMYVGACYHELVEKIDSIATLKHSRTADRFKL